VALPWPQLRPPEHQDAPSDHRPAGGRGRDSGDLAQTEAFSEEGNAAHPQAQPCCECAHGWRAGAHDSEAGGAQEAVHDGDLCFCGPGAGEGGV